MKQLNNFKISNVHIACAEHLAFEHIFMASNMLCFPFSIVMQCCFYWLALFSSQNFFAHVFRWWQNCLPMTINKQAITRVIQRNQTSYINIYVCMCVMKAFATFHDLHYLIRRNRYASTNKYKHTHNFTSAQIPYTQCTRTNIHYIHNTRLVLIGLMKANNFSNEL